MFKNKKTVVIEEFDENGKCVKKTTTVEETENDFKETMPFTGTYTNPNTITTGDGFYYDTGNTGI